VIRQELQPAEVEKPKAVIIIEPKTPVKSPVKPGEDDKFLDSPSNENEISAEREKEYQSPLKAGGTFLKLALNSEIAESPVKTTKRISRPSSVAKSQQPGAAQPLVSSGPANAKPERVAAESPKFGQKLDKVEEPPTPTTALPDLKPLQ